VAVLHKGQRGASGSSLKQRTTKNAKAAEKAAVVGSRPGRGLGASRLRYR